jgi:photosystem II stability/assembly factor-like uncharacterized protein
VLKPARIRTLLIALFSFALFAGACSAPDPQLQQQADATPAEEWNVIGPGGGGGMFLPTISPHDQNVAMMHCDMTAAYITRDAANWRLLDFWTVPEDCEFDPVDPDVIYAASRGYRYSEGRGMGLTLLVRSADGGQSWKIIYPLVENAIYHGPIQGRDLLPSQIVEGAFDGTIETIEVDPSDNKKIYLGMAPLVSYMSGGRGAPQQQAFLVATDDGGASWRKVTDLPGRSVLAIFPSALTGRLTVFTEKGCVVVNETSGETETLPLPAARILDADGGVSSGGPLLYVLAPIRRNGDKLDGGVFRSSDGAKSWTAVNTGLLHDVPDGKVPRFRSMALCESRAEMLYLSSSNDRVARQDTTLWLYGVFKSENAGDSWKPSWLANGTGYLTENFTQGWLDDEWGPGWGGNPIALGVAPQNPDICIGTDAGRSYKTVDGGRTWRQIHSKKNSDGTFSTKGLNVTTCYGVHFDPYDPKHLFISYTDIGLFHSYDGGKRWSHSLDGVPRGWTNTCYWLEFDPEVEGRAWSVWGNAHDLPRDKMYSPRGFGYNSGGVAISDDAGRSWRPGMEGIPENSVGTHVMIDPDSPRDSRTVYATMFGRGVYKSIDGGASWTEVNNGLGDNLFAWKIHRAADGMLYLIIARGLGYEDGDRRKPFRIDGELYSSDDNAASWKKMDLPGGENAPHDLLTDPLNPDRILLCCWAVAGEGGDVGGGVYRSDNGGAGWELVFNDVKRVNSIALDPNETGTLYINTFQNAAFRGKNWGDSWQRIKGYRFKWGQRPIPDIHNPGMLYLSTYGGSVQHGPAKGVTEEKPDITNMPKNWW